MMRIFFSDGIQVLVMVVVSFVNLLRCVFADICRAQGMVFLGSQHVVRLSSDIW